MRKIGLILIVAIASGCYEPKNYDFNPFDDEFLFHKNFKISDYDTIMGECGFWNLTKRNDGLETYYQFFTNKKPIVAKGFDLDIDEILVDDKDSLESETYLKKLWRNRPINFELVRQRLSPFKIKEINIVRQTDAYLDIELIDVRDSVYTASIIMALLEDNKITRQLQYFNGRRTYY
jgi:hypothetical protein